MKKIRFQLSIEYRMFWVWICSCWVVVVVWVVVFVLVSLSVAPGYPPDDVIVPFRADDEADPFPLEVLPLAATTSEEEGPDVVLLPEDAVPCQWAICSNLKSVTSKSPVFSSGMKMLTNQSRMTSTSVWHFFLARPSSITPVLYHEELSSSPWKTIYFTNYFSSSHYLSIFSKLHSLGKIPALLRRCPTWTFIPILPISHLKCCTWSIVFE